jgi:hypothetical protein
VSQGQRPTPAEWSGEEYGLPFPDGTPLMLRGQLQAGSRDASPGFGWGSSPALHVVVAAAGYPAAACDRRILIDATVVTSAAKVRPAGRCRRPACSGLFAAAEPAAPAPAAPAAAPGPSVFRCTGCGRGGNLRAWAHVNIHGDVGPDGHIEESVTCKIHGEDLIEKLVDGQYTAHFDMAAGCYAAAPAAPAIARPPRCLPVTRTITRLR